MTADSVLAEARWPAITHHGHTYVDSQAVAVTLYQLAAVHGPHSDLLRALADGFADLEVAP